jgi:hypothetical protein
MENTKKLIKYQVIKDGETDKKKIACFDFYEEAETFIESKEPTLDNGDFLFIDPVFDKEKVINKFFKILKKFHKENNDENFLDFRHSYIDSYILEKINEAHGEGKQEVEETVYTPQGKKTEIINIEF